MVINDTIRARWYGGARDCSQIIAVVFHYTANTGRSATARSNAQYFAAGTRKASAHFIVDEGETAYQCVPLTQTAWAVGDGNGGSMGALVNNANSVSIEMVSHTDGSGISYLPEQTLRNAARLYGQICKELPNVRYVVRHYDVSGKRCPAPLVDEKAWSSFLRMLKEELCMTKQELLSIAGTGDVPSDWAKEAAKWAREQEIFTGDGAGNYGWQQPVTREAVAQVLYRLWKKTMAAERNAGKAD